MKRFLTIIILLISVNVFAQTNDCNWFTGVNVGTSYTNNFGVSSGLYAGKWITPYVGLEMGINNIVSFTTKEMSISYSDANWDVVILRNKTVPFWIGETYGKVLFNVTRTRSCWDLILYPTVSTYYNTDDWMIGAGGGVINHFNVSKHLSIDVDGKVTVGDKKSYLTKNGITPSVNVGVTYHFGGHHKKRHDSYDYVPQRITDTMVIHKTDTVYVNKYVKSRYVATFDLNSSKLKSIEMNKIKEFMSNVDRDHKITLIGSADSKTGNTQRNETLAIDRANVIKAELIKMGFDDISILTQIDIFENMELSRSVVIEIE